ncbi:hypothetical protein PCH70_49660 [Pseudomonas cichorii JBC1]|nr:hypothetical protein PCH70_49660 [Pseudomonas cichorii JBC1]
MAECFKRFCSKKTTTTTAEKWAGLCQKSPKMVGPSCQNRITTAHTMF